MNYLVIYLLVSQISKRSLAFPTTPILLIPSLTNNTLLFPLLKLLTVCIFDRTKSVLLAQETSELTSQTCTTIPFEAELVSGGLGYGFQGDVGLDVAFPIEV